MRAFLGLCLFLSLATSASGAPAKSPFAIAEIREPRKNEVPFEEASHYLRPGEFEERNKVFGPRGLVAYVRTNHRHSYLEILDQITGEDSVFVYPNVSLPSWSPDGKYLSVSLWTTETRMGKLVVFEVSTWNKVVDLPLASAASAKWSPDSKRIASDGVSYEKNAKVLLYEVTVPGASVTVIDSCRVMGDIEFSWSPDSRWVVYSKPTKVHHVGDTMVSDLMLGNAETGEAWTLIPGTDHNQSNPLWINDHTVQIDRVWWNEEDTNREDRVVVVLKPAR